MHEQYTMSQESIDAEFAFIVGDVLSVTDEHLSVDSAEFHPPIPLPGPVPITQRVREKYRPVPDVRGAIIDCSL